MSIIRGAKLSLSCGK